MKPAVSVKRVIMVLRVLALVVIVGFIMAGHPPSRAEVRSGEISAEDVRQDTDIIYINGHLSVIDAAAAATQAIVVKQGEDLARLDTKMTMLVAFLGLLQVGGMFLSIFPLKRFSQPLKEGRE